MIKQKQQQLSDLNQAYLNGELTYHDYRQKRGFMLEGLFEDITVTEDFNPQTVPMISTESLPTNNARKDSNTLIYIAIIGLIIGIAIAASFILLSTDDTKETETTYSGQKITLASIVDESIRSNNWTPEKLSKIQSYWAALSPNQKQAAQSKAWHKKLTDSLKNVALEQKPLTELGNSNAIKFDKQIRQLLIELHKKY